MKKIFVFTMIVILLTACGAPATPVVTTPATMIVDTSSQILGIKANPGEITLFFSVDGYNTNGGMRATVSSFGEIAPPIKIKVKITLSDGTKFETTIVPGVQFEIPSSDFNTVPVEVAISAKGWNFVRRGESSIWDAKPPQ